MLLQELGSLDVVACKPACGKLEDSPLSEDMVRKGRHNLVQALKLEDPQLEEADLERVSQLQPLLLLMLTALAKEVGDPDAHVLAERHTSYSDGVPLGVGSVLRRTLAVLGRKV